MRTATTIEASAGKDAVEFAVEAERLGLGVSGPQVMEGLHGVPFGHPLGRMRETVEIVRRTFTGEKVTYAGRHYGLPLPGGYGSKPMRVGLPPVSVPVYLATLSPKMLELTGEIADGWLGTSFIPERADAYFSYLDAGLARTGRTRASLDVCQGAEISLVPEAELADTIASRKKELAFSLGGMGTATANFYNDAYSRQGWAEVAAEVRARLRAWRESGVDTVRLYPAGDTLTTRLSTLARGIELVRDVTVSSSGSGVSG